MYPSTDVWNFTPNSTAAGSLMDGLFGTTEVAQRLQVFGESHGPGICAVDGMTAPKRASNVKRKQVRRSIFSRPLLPPNRVAQANNRIWCGRMASHTPPATRRGQAKTFHFFAVLEEFTAHAAASVSIRQTFVSRAMPVCLMGSIP